MATAEGTRNLDMNIVLLGMGGDVQPCAGSCTGWTPQNVFGKSLPWLRALGNQFRREGWPRRCGTSVSAVTCFGCLLRYSLTPDGLGWLMLWRPHA